ncbi:MAG TPA: winged helix-turn-helix transcriptional regulator [Azospirillaceae bacterium]|nr:winged helix-turn-helix transcriptional regulator [Azospirillaceae bacterium]
MAGRLPSDATRSPEIGTAVRLLEAFRRLDPDLPIQYALSFLTIAENEGLSMRELSEKLGIAQSSASRNVAALSRWHSFGKPGHDLVEAHEDPRERRRKVITLTDKGRALLEELRAIVNPKLGTRKAG